MDYCPKCGFSFKDGLVIQERSELNFCPKCGMRLEAIQETDEAAGDLESRVIELMRQNQMLEAVKLVREQTDKSLKESKDMVLAIVKRNLSQLKGPEKTARRRFATYLIVAGFIGLMISSAGIAIFPQFGLVAKPFLCGGDLRIHSEQLYTPPGMAGTTIGVSRSFQCPDGTPRSGMVFLISTAAYTLILLVLLYVRRVYKILRGSS